MIDIIHNNKKFTQRLTTPQEIGPISSIYCPVVGDTVESSHTKDHFGGDVGDPNEQNY